MPLADQVPRYSGRVLVRLPQGLHAALAERAAEEGTSLNQLIVAMLAGGMAWDGSLQSRNQRETRT